MKSSVEQIRERFDQEVERFSNLETGQAATVDARLCMELVTEAAAAVAPAARDLLDIGCGAGNYTLMLLRRIPGLRSTLVDLSGPMLERATARISAAGATGVTALRGDMRELELGEGRFDIVLASATLHHLRGDSEWHAMFAEIFRALRPGGCFWIFDLVEQAAPAVQHIMKSRWGDYLANLKGEGLAGDAYRDAVFAYIEQEDTPRPLMFQLDALRQAGFTDLDVLHKNTLFAAFGGRKPARG